MVGIASGVKICEVCQQLVALVEAPNPRKSSIVFYNASGTPSSLNEKEREKQKEMERDRESRSPIFHERILPLMPRFRHPVSLSPSLPLFPPFPLSLYLARRVPLARSRVLRPLERVAASVGPFRTSVHVENASLSGPRGSDSHPEACGQHRVHDTILLLLASKYRLKL